MSSRTPAGTPDRPKVHSNLQADRTFCSAEPTPCASRADVLTGRAAGRSGVPGLPIERLERGGVDGRYLTIRAEAHPAGSMPSALVLRPEQWPRPGGVVDSAERLPDQEARASR